MKNKVIRTKLGNFSKEKFNSLINVRDITLESFREILRKIGYSEVTTSSLVNIAGSCENPNASFTLNYYGREAHLSQSAQIQLEAIVIRLKRGVFTVNNSFREENYEDPEAQGRRLSEFTLIEPERPYKSKTLEDSLQELINEETKVVKTTIKKVLEQSLKDIEILGGNTEYLIKILSKQFQRISYDEALKILGSSGKKNYFGMDFGIREEREILRYFDNTPTFVSYFPASIKFFNMKRTTDGQRVYSVDLLMPNLGETSGGALREENGERIKKQLRESRIGKHLIEKGQDPIVPFTEYFNLFEQELPVLRGGYGIGFERFIGFLINSNDILDTIRYKTLEPL